MPFFFLVNGICISEKKKKTLNRELYCTLYYYHVYYFKNPMTETLPSQLGEL